MNKYTQKTNKDPHAPDWWSKKPDMETKVQWQEAVTDFLIATDEEPENLVFGIDLVKKVLPFAKKYDYRWKGFNPEDLNTYIYAGHQSFYNQIRNKLDALKEENKKKIPTDSKPAKGSPRL